MKTNWKSSLRDGLVAMLIISGLFMAGSGLIVVWRLGADWTKRQVFLNKRDQICIRVTQITDRDKTIELKNNGRAIFNCEY
jgi:hypothetical protein